MIVDCAVYTDGRRSERAHTPAEAYAAARSADDTFVWIGLHEPTAEEFGSVRREFGLHELAVEDAIKAHQRPKLEVYGETLFLVLKTARYKDSEEVIDFGEIFLFVGKGFIVSVRHGEASDLHPVREAIERRPELLGHGPDAVLHAIVDKVVDDYQPAADGLDGDVTEVEEQVFSDARHNPAERIYKLKREAVEFHRAAAPLVEPLLWLARGGDGHIDQEIRDYFRDVYDHLERVAAQVDSYRDLLTSVLAANLTQVTVRQNDDMRKISAWVAVLAVPTMIAGVYGMNFDHMPELRWTYGYPAVIAVMLVVCLALHRYFHRIGWL